MRGGKGGGKAGQMGLLCVLLSVPVCEGMSSVPATELRSGLDTKVCSGAVDSSRPGLSLAASGSYHLQMQSTSPLSEKWELQLITGWLQEQSFNLLNTRQMTV